MMESNHWFLFKHENGLPIVFYNSETGEHRWANGFNHVTCTRASLDEIPRRYDNFKCKKQKQKVKIYSNIATETEKDNFLREKAQEKVSEDASTNTDHIVLEDSASFVEKLASIKEKESFKRQEDVLENLYDVCKEKEFIPVASPPGNPFNIDSNKEEEAIDNEYCQSLKESLVHNLFAMELSSVLSYEDLQQNSCRETHYGPNLEPSVTPESNLHTKEMEIDSSEKQEKVNKLDPPIMKMKLEPVTDDFQEEQAPGNVDSNAGDFSLIDLLPKKHKRKFKCPLCKRSFKTPSSLQRHEMFVHSGEVVTKPRPHACTICDKRFVEANCLRKHLRTHTGEKPYCCPFCGKGFAQSQNLNKHKYIHTDSRPHKCKDCGKRFRQHSHLARHKLIHTGEKPFQCAECPKNYRTRSHLVRHFKSSKHEGLIDNTKKS